MTLETLCIDEVTGPAIADHISVVADLRIRLFRDYPYFYDGSPEYERHYLRELANNDEALLLMALSGDDVAGVATSLPLESGADILKGVPGRFRAAGLDPAAFYYYSEILVVPRFRGRGIAGEFYRRREAFARGKGYGAVSFAAVIRPDDDPRRPESYFYPAPYWASMGFGRRDDITVACNWPTLEPDGSVAEKTHPLAFWVKSL